MKILITGSEGTIGRLLRVELERRGHEVYGVDLMHTERDRYFRADLSDYRQIGAVFASGHFDAVYHLAAEFGRINGELYYEQLWRSNVIGTRNILELQLKYGFKLLHASSSEIYGNCNSELLREDDTDHYAIRQLNDYATTKWVNEVQIMNFEAKYGNPCVRLRFFNTYGPGELYHKYRSVVCLFAYRALHGLPYEVYEGYRRAFIYIDDFIPTLANVCDNFKAGEVYNIGGAEYRSVRELSDLVLAAAGCDDRHVTYLPEDKHNVISKRPDCTKAARDFGHHPVVTLEDGVFATIAWMRKEYFG